MATTSEVIAVFSDDVDVEGRLLIADHDRREALALQYIEGFGGSTPLPALRG